jgi:hypothetical protein
MKRIALISLILILAVSALSACGSRSGGGADPNAPASVNVIPSKTVALATGSDVVTVQADVRKADGTAVADGTVVSFSVSTAVLSAPSAATTNGLASVTMTCAAVPGANNYTAVVTAAAGDASGTKDVKFINQPVSVDVSIAFDQPVTNLAALQLKLNNGAGAAFNNADPQLISAVNAATGSTVVGNFVAANNNTIGLINAAGFNTGTTSIIKATYSVAAGAGLPAFSVDAAATFTATDKDGNATAPQVSSANVVVTTKFDTE